MTDKIWGFGAKIRGLVQRPQNPEDEDDFGDILGNLRKPGNPIISNNPKAQQVQNQEQPKVKDEPADEPQETEVFEDAWGIDDDIDLDNVPEVNDKIDQDEEPTQPPKEEPKKEEAPRKGSNPFSNITQKATSFMDKINNKLVDGGNSKAAKPQNSDNNFSNIMDNMISKNRDKDRKTSFNDFFNDDEPETKPTQQQPKVQNEPSPQKGPAFGSYSSRAAQNIENNEELSKLQNQMHEYFTQSHQLEVLADMERQMHREEHENRMAELDQREADIESKEQILNDKEKELSIKDEKIKLKEGLNVDEEHLDSVAKELQEYKQQIKLLQETIQLKDAELSSQEEKLKQDLQEQLQDLTQKKNSEQQELLDQQKEQYESQLQQEKEQSQSTIQSLQNKQQALISKVKGFASMFVGVKKQIKDQMNEISQELWSKGDEVLGTMSFAEQVKNKLLGVTKNYQSALKTKDSKIHQLQESDKKLQGELNGLNQEYSKARNEFKSKSSEFKALKEKLEDENETLKEKLLVQETKMDEFRMVADENKTTIEELTKKLSEAEREYKDNIQNMTEDNETNIQQLEKEIEDLRLKVKLGGSGKKASSNEQQLIEQFTELSTKFNDLKKENTALVQKTEKEKASVKADYEDKFKNLNVYVEQLYQRNHELQSENDKLNGKFNKLKEKLHALDANFKNLNVHSSHVASPRTELKQFLANLNIISGTSSNATPEKTESHNETFSPEDQKDPTHSRDEKALEENHEIIQPQSAKPLQEVIEEEKGKSNNDSPDALPKDEHQYGGSVEAGKYNTEYGNEKQDNDYLVVESANAEGWDDQNIDIDVPESDDPFARQESQPEEKDTEENADDQKNEAEGEKKPEEEQKKPESPKQQETKTIPKKQPTVEDDFFGNDDDGENKIDFGFPKVGQTKPPTTSTATTNKKGGITLPPATKKIEIKKITSPAQAKKEVKEEVDDDDDDDFFNDFKIPAKKEQPKQAAKPAGTNLDSAKTPFISKPFAGNNNKKPQPPKKQSNDDFLKGSQNDEKPHQNLFKTSQPEEDEHHYNPDSEEDVPNFGTGHQNILPQDLLQQQELEETESSPKKIPSLQDIPSEAIDLKLDAEVEGDPENNGWAPDDIDLDVATPTQQTEINSLSVNVTANTRTEPDKPPSFSDLDSPRRTVSAREKQKVDSNASFSHDNIPQTQDDQVGSEPESPKFDRDSPTFETKSEGSPPKFDQTLGAGGGISNNVVIDKTSNSVGAFGNYSSPKFEQQSPKFETGDGDRSHSKEEVPKKGGRTNDSFSNIEDQNDGWEVDVDISGPKDQSRGLDNPAAGGESPKFEGTNDSPGFGGFQDFGSTANNNNNDILGNINNTSTEHHSSTNPNKQLFTLEKLESEEDAGGVLDEPKFGGSSNNIQGGSTSGPNTGRRRSPSFSNAGDDDLAKSKEEIGSPTFKPTDEQLSNNEPQSPRFTKKGDDSFDRKFEHSPDETDNTNESPSFLTKDQNKPNKAANLQPQISNFNSGWDYEFDLPNSSKSQETKKGGFFDISTSPILGAEKKAKFGYGSELNKSNEGTSSKPLFKSKSNTSTLTPVQKKNNTVDELINMMDQIDTSQKKRDVSKDNSGWDIDILDFDQSQTKSNTTGLIRMDSAPQNETDDNSVAPNFGGGQPKTEPQEHSFKLDSESSSSPDGGRFGQGVHSFQESPAFESPNKEKSKQQQATNVGAFFNSPSVGSKGSSDGKKPGGIQLSSGKKQQGPSGSETKKGGFVINTNLIKGKDAQKPAFGTKKDSKKDINIDEFFDGF